MNVLRKIRRPLHLYHDWSPTTQIYFNGISYYLVLVDMSAPGILMGFTSPLSWVWFAFKVRILSVLRPDPCLLLSLRPRCNDEARLELVMVIVWPGWSVRLTWTAWEDRDFQERSSCFPHILQFENIVHHHWNRSWSRSSQYSVTPFLAARGIYPLFQSSWGSRLYRLLILYRRLLSSDLVPCMYRTDPDRHSKRQGVP